uniref:NADH dehydrogenase subunit 6 n=2 Tax=Amblyomma TaxID=6942 RepID=L7PCD0_AMBCJ|nr:NADH dehydrogenase subunit 6 [Amblyomma cajennense]YP_009332021.1 NADH dehydrogenase subunit 6 [Amblyomma sculptum]AFU55275.1 NADH dehydrogenase subunit 6 [Amblyomma cajennense]APH07718.1 NADH dehydrogenase subunit 6 [Amblyomma sculptum]WEF75038.1 NADH dehydrogenase subunit 6 [Amblyomma sculptum]
MKLFLMISIVLISMSHPMMMLIAVILLTLFISLLFYTITENSLFPLIMILMILGGMLIIFMYIISLCPNKKMNFNYKISIVGFAVLFLNLNFMFMKILNQNLIKIYFFTFVNMLILLMLYLLITLSVILKNLNWISSPMKSN